MLAEIVRSRRTVGSFTSEPIDERVVESALELATWAPNHRKTEPWRFTWLGPETRTAVIALNSEIITAKSGAAAAETKRQQWSTIPGWIAVTCRRSSDAFLMEEDYAACCCAVQNLMLAFWSHGVGTKWSTGEVTRHPGYAELVGFDPAEERTVGLIWYGTPAALPTQSRRPITDVVRRRP
ncbi:nitroreductase [bacterium]|nr:nitroreductase [bacterium]